MTTLTQHGFAALAGRFLIGALALVALLLMGVGIAQSGEIVPSLGITKSVDEGTESKLYAGLAFRGAIFPMVKSEIGIAYRDESRLDDNLNVRMWPVTASLLLTPLPMLYAGGGVGWYYTTFDYNEVLPFQDTTKQKFGVHLGGGLGVPLGPVLGLDLQGRYVFFDKVGSPLPPQSFNPDYRTTSLGLAIKF